MYLILSIIILISFIIFCSCVYYSRKTKNANHGANQITEVLSLITAIITFISSISSIFVSSYEIINSNSNTNTNQNNNIIINKIDIPTSETESQTKEQIVNQIKLAVQTNDYEELALLLENEKVVNDGKFIAYKAFLYGNGLYYEKDLQRAYKLLDMAANIGYKEAVKNKLYLSLKNSDINTAAEILSNEVSEKESYILTYLSHFDRGLNYNEFTHEQQLQFITDQFYEWTYIGKFTFNSIQITTDDKKYVRVSSSINTNRNGELDSSYTYLVYFKTIKYEEDIVFNIQEKYES